MSDLYVSLDAENEPTIWRPGYRGIDFAVLRRCDLAPDHRDAWDELTAGMEVRA